MNFQNDRPDPHDQDEVEARIEWLASAAGKELWDHWSTAGYQADRRVINFMRHIATTCRRAANYLEKQNLQ
jgi:hypothetical protein